MNEMARGDVARVRPEEIPAIATIERQTFSDPWSETAFREALANPRVFFAAVHETAAAANATEGDGGAVAGYVVAWFILDEGEIANLAVAAERRGRGFGARLLDAALAEGERSGVTTMYLEVRSSNHRARELYRSRGFVEVGRRPQYYRRPVEDAIILRRTPA
ncbi:MAG TPA: ribosomal protein S18-alanine N-acetyltransferase [Gemmatimonadaceae bacterium]|nr:ribosomal protein S18-alanine N-acetyltransferase [Gemmatimonadaceae bacterium]